MPVVAGSAEVGGTTPVRNACVDVVWDGTRSTALPVVVGVALAAVDCAVMAAVVFVVVAAVGVVVNTDVLSGVVQDAVRS